MNKRVDQLIKSDFSKVKWEAEHDQVMICKCMEMSQKNLLTCTINMLIKTSDCVTLAFPLAWSASFKTVYE